MRFESMQGVEGKTPSHLADQLAGALGHYPENPPRKPDISGVAHKNRLSGRLPICQLICATWQRSSWRLGILINSPPAFSAEPSCFHVLHQKRGRAELLAQRFVEVLENMQARVQADQVDQFKRPHGMV